MNLPGTPSILKTAVEWNVFSHMILELIKITALVFAAQTVESL